MHQQLITYIADDVQVKLPPRYVVAIDERIYVEEPEKTVFPDVLVKERLMP